MKFRLKNKYTIKEMLERFPITKDLGGSDYWKGKCLKCGLPRLECQRRLDEEQK